MKMSLRNTGFLLAGIFIGMLLLGCSGSKSLLDKNSGWVGTWTTAPQLVEPHNMPPAPGLTDYTIRQIVRVSVGGEEVRLRFSNAFSKSPVEMKLAAIAQVSEGGSIDVSSQKLLKFNKNESVTMNPGGEVYSDPINFNLKSGSLIAITIHFGQTSPDVTGHPGSRTTSFILPGNNIASADFSGSIKTDHWYVIQGIDVKASKNSKAVAVLGNSITDGRGSGTNKQNRWPDILSAKLLANESTKNIGVLNLGIGGNCVVEGGISEPAMKRFDRDILGQTGVDKLVIFEGTNDIGCCGGNYEHVADTLVACYKVLIAKAKAKGIKVYGATITPTKGNGWYSYWHEAMRQQVNEWIRKSGSFDEIIDFDELVRDPQDPQRLKAEYSDDWLHLNPKGYEVMGKFAAEKLK